MIPNLHARLKNLHWMTASLEGKITSFNAHFEDSN